MNQTHPWINRNIPYEFTHLLQTVKCRLTIISVKDGIVRARIPASVMALPFPPAGKEHNVLLFPVEKVARFFAKN